MKKLEKSVIGLLEILALIIALAAVIIFVFYLLLAYNKCIIFTEPIGYIRWSEVALGIIAIPVLLLVLLKKVKRFYRG